MSKGKKARARASKYVSKGQVATVNKKTRNANRTEYLQSYDRMLNQQRALNQGKDVVLTIANPNKQETNKRFIKVKVNGKQYLAAKKYTPTQPAVLENANGD